MLMTRAQYESVIDLLGVSAQFTHVKTQTQVQLAKVGIRTNSTNEALVNAYGVGSKTLTVKQSSLPFTPEKFDFMIVNNEKLVIEAVTLVHEPGSGDIIGFRCFVKGK
jgi:hypothetical protein